MSFGSKLKALRKENNMSQDELAQKLNLSRSTISGYEGKKGRQPSHEKIKEIANTFHVSIDYLINDDVVSVDCIHAPYTINSPDEKLLIDKYRLFSDSSKRKLFEYIRLLELDEFGESP